MSRPPTLSVEQSRELDRLATEEFGLPSYLLMENAGREMALHIGRVLDYFPRTSALIFLCGYGRNAGDGFVAARHLYLKHPNIKLYVTNEEEKFNGDARINYKILKKLGLPIGRYENFITDRQTIFSGLPLVFVDALLGTGLKREADGVFKNLIQDVTTLKKYHNAKSTVIAADIPTGLHGDNGPVWPTVMPADLTVTFGCYKKGLLLPESKAYVGRLEIVDIGLPEPLLKRYQS
jgi:hydroxyethylthiazole kinase-like uncharacterized protein yjeF